MPRMNMKYLDIFAIVIIVPLILFSPLGKDNSPLQNVLLRFGMFVICFLCLCPATGWIGRMKDHLKRKRLLNSPVQHINGEFFLRLPKPVGSTWIYVSDGYSQSLRTGDVYAHYHYEKSCQYEGEHGWFHPLDNITPTFEVFTLPRSFWGDNVTFDYHYATDVDFSYVVDEKDGKRYYIGARLLDPAYEAQVKENVRQYYLKEKERSFWQS